MLSRYEAHEHSSRWKELMTREDLEMTVLRFLVGKQGDVDVAFAAFEKSMEWRDEHHADKVLDFDDPLCDDDTPFDKEVRKYVADLTFNGVSKQGMPLAWELKGRIDVLGLVKNVTPDQYSQRLAYSLIASNRYMNKKSREDGRLLGICLVYCCKNISTGHMKFLPYFKYEVDWSQLNCPELLGESIVINTPWFFNMIWQIVKPWLDKRTLAKVHILGGAGSEQQLEEYIDRKFIPTILGGDDPAPKMIVPDPLKGLDKIDVAAGRKQEFEFHAQNAPLSICWKWSPVAKDISFYVTFVDADDQEDQVVENSRISATGEVFDGSFVTSKPGTLKIVFDNSFSYWTSKQVMFWCGGFEELANVGV
eukprot:TRINITY_DN1729_c0_g1_i2.p1 TRINITY_DN1729_c0_g1~~TRINITY_DN1729_c0_g1_i2.p1  ORF type:complete len:364 (-),score=88.42 TRINITY_DN1729_c0_g1_i2:771-1862(-)